MQTDDDLITSGEAARLLGVTVKTIIRWATVEPVKITPVQKLPGLRGAYLFSPTDVEALREVA